MIIRKPYAFLIKNFRKVHAVLLLISLYVLFKLLDVSSFISDFMSFGIYDYSNNPIGKHVTIFLHVAIFVLLVGSFFLVLLLKRKEKPWKIYLVPIIEYVALFLVLGMITSFFNHFNNGIATTDVRLSRDLLVILILGNFATIGIFGMRLLGMDINKFNFASDEEFLELAEEDREEVELRVKIDKNIFIRLYNRTVRNLNYFYLEHKRLCNSFFGIIGLVLLAVIAKTIFVTNKSYNEGDFYSANGYTIKINKSYFTDKDYKGEIISKDSNFVVVDLTITNNAESRIIKLDNFHLKTGVSDFTTTRKTYEKEFQDLGTTYNEKKELKREETAQIIIVFKVAKELNKDNFALFYQEGTGTLRKIKLNITDISEIKDKGIVKIGENLTLKLKRKETISLDSYAFTDKVTYPIRKCNTEKCVIEKVSYNATKGNKVLKVDFASDNFEGKDMVDFCADYGKINYIDNNKMEHSVEFKYPFQNQAIGKTLYTLVPDEVVKSETLEFVYVIRNEKYTYKLK
ncbi:MAG: hypothetical protein IJI58_01555 [Bacilli bacterium]|nr:hypothetical protein [Bacilli bacterium]